MNSSWAALRNPIFRRLWIASLISGTCVAAHNNAVAYMMSPLGPSPLLIALISSVALLPFFLFTVPAGAKLTDAQMQSLQSGNLYVNVHSAANPNGEIRAQLGP